MIPVAEPAIVGNELKYLTECIETRWISSLGRFVTEFEQSFCKRYGFDYALTTSSGTSALHLALLAANIGKGDEVIVPSMTFVATANAVTYTGATPVFVDADADTWNIDVSKIENAITAKTKAIIPVHLFGQVCEMDTLHKICLKHNILLIEDAAEAQEAKWKDQFSGSFGEFSIFSFYGNKLITTGEGGMLVCKNKEAYEYAKMLRDHAMSPTQRYYHPEIGYNYRITNMQAALGLAQMEQIDSILAKKINNAELYLSELSGANGLQLPMASENCKHVYWMFSIVLKKEVELSRDDFMDQLKSRGIDSRPFFYPIHLLPSYRKTEKVKELPVSEYLGERGVSLPSSILLEKEQIKFISQSIREIIGHK